MGEPLTDELLRKLVELYTEDKKKNNISQLSKRYKIPYPTLRRKIAQYLLQNDLEDLVREEYLPVEGFDYLSVGDTFQFEAILTIWYVKTQKKLDGDLVWVIIPTKQKGKRHWVGRKLVGENDD